MQPILQVYLEIVHPSFRTWGVQFSGTIETLDPWIVHEFRIWRRGLVGP